MATKKIALFGLFGVGNFGNEASLEAVLQHVCRNQPELDVICVCADPDDVTARHHVDTISIHMGTESAYATVSNSVFRLCLRALYELVVWIRIYHFLRTVDLVVVPGTGILDDFGVSPWQMPYHLFRWSLIAKLARTKFYFVSIGAGPIHHPVSRWFMKQAARFATYRSYRDTISKEYMESIAFDTQQDQIYPDLVFSLQTPIAVQRQTTRISVGLGVMAYYGWYNDTVHGEEIYQAYLHKLVTFASWLLRRGYSLRLLVGQQTDQRMVDDLQCALAEQVKTYQSERVVAEPINSIQDLMAQISLTDLVVGTRFHNVLCALMLNKPVISLGYAKKNDDLMAEMGLEPFCQHVESFDVEQLKQQFVLLEQQAHFYRKQLCRCNDEYRQALAQQYALIFGGE
ncbi:MAG: polysaccharide pyruvyl transferase family protein [Caldilineaceae bacterium]|nr:polysaccharide pyruvyl transferase family protein [Caldilineaceae bacterium]